MSSSLYEQWNSRNDKRLHKTPISVRLPVHVFARLLALQEMHPDKSRNDLLIDLIKAGFDTFENSMPPMAYTTEVLDEQNDSTLTTPITVKFPYGYRADYYKAANKHFIEAEMAIGTYKPSPLFDVEPKEVKK